MPENEVKLVLKIDSADAERAINRVRGGVASSGGGAPGAGGPSNVDHGAGGGVGAAGAGAAGMGAAGSRLLGASGLAGLTGTVTALFSAAQFLKEAAGDFRSVLDRGLFTPTGRGISNALGFQDVSTRMNATDMSLDWVKGAAGLGLAGMSNEQIADMANAGRHAIFDPLADAYRRLEDMRGRFHENTFSRATPGWARAAGDVADWVLRNVFPQFQSGMGQR